MIKGIAVSQGIAMGRAFLLQEEKICIQENRINDIEFELHKLQQGINKAIDQLKKIAYNAKKNIGESEAHIFEAHLLVLEDPEFISQIKAKIRDEVISAEFAVKQVSDTFIQIFSAMENEYMKERAADIKDVSTRLINNVLGKEMREISLINEEVIIIAKDLTPSETAQINKEFILGFVTDIGGKTSHTAIMARTLEIPAVVGTGSITERVKHGDFIILDAKEGIIFINPEDEIINSYKQKKAEFEEFVEKLKELKDLPAITKDNHQVELAANIGTPKDVEAVLSNGGEAVGLYRTEFLYMDRNELPSEKEQFKAYRAVAEGMKGKPVIIRTLDIGGDKQLSYLKLPEEMNPFLGWRAIRICLEKRDIFKTQLRAILKASDFGKLRVMFPMISNLQELIDAKRILEECKNELREENVKFDENIEVGIMIEIPSAAVIADVLAQEVDFFSIGTNDLCQYTLAVDRMNEKISELYQPFHPAILKLIKMVIDASHKHDKFTGMCGEMASDPLATVILLGLGLDEFSMSASAIPSVKNTIRSIDYAFAKEVAEYVLKLKTSDEIKEYVGKKIKKKLCKKE